MRHGRPTSARAVLESTTDGYVGVDRDWRIGSLNRRGADLLTARGLLPEAIVGRTVGEVRPDLMGTELERQHRRAMFERVESTFEVRKKMPSLEERLQQAQRMDAVGRLAGGVVHEVNNQMTVVLGASSFLLRRTDLPDWARADLEQIRQAAQRSGAITGQLLAFGRRQPLGTLELVDQVHTDGRLQLVVIDLAMPTMGGRELAERLRGARPPRSQPVHHGVYRG